MLAALALTFALAACGSGPTALDDGGSTGVVQSVDVVENDSLVVEAATASDTVVAVLRDAGGNPVAGDLASFEIEGGDDAECGFWEASTLQSNAAGEVKNTLTAGEIAWTAGGSTPDCRYRVVHSSEGAPEPIRDSVQVRVEPGPPERTPIDRVFEDGTFRSFGEDPPARVGFSSVWRDRFENPHPHRLSVDDGPVEVVARSSFPWARHLKATGPEGSGTFTAWTHPDSTDALEGQYEVTHYQANGEQQIWLCAVLEPHSLSECEGPPDDL